MMIQAVLALLLNATVGNAAAPQFGPMQRVTLDGVINDDTDDTLAFTPDCKSVFFDRSQGSRKTIMISHRSAGRWETAVVASFSGRWFDQDPVIAPDGRYMLFNSDRPVRPGNASLMQTYFSKKPAPGSNIWRVERKGEIWGEPVWIGPRINNDVFVDFAAIAGNNALYFMRWDTPSRNMQLWRAAYRGGDYEVPERVMLGDPTVSIHDPAVSRDESFIVFDYGKVIGGLGRLSIAFRHGSGWSQPIDLGDAVNADLPWGAHVSLDERAVNFTGRSGIWRLSLDGWLSHSSAPRRALPQQFTRHRSIATTTRNSAEFPRHCQI